MKSAGLFERVGRYMPTILAGGAFMVEATKRVYPPKGKVQKARKRISVLDGLTEPVVGRAHSS